MANISKGSCPFCDYEIKHEGINIDVGGVLSNHIEKTHSDEMWAAIFNDHMDRVKSILLGNSIHKFFGRKFVRRYPKEQP
jgi:hypothetical protein